jgi:hypothetical protein
MLEAVPDLCTDMCVTASDDGNKAIKVEDGSYVLEEEDPLAVTVPATKAEKEVSYIQQASCSPALLGPRYCQKYPVSICGWIWAVLTEVFIISLSAS